MCRDVTDGLVTLHSHSVVHGDIKGDNVLVFKLSIGPEAPILDMDGSHLEGTTADIPNQGILLSRVFLRQRLDRDVYSFGLLLCEVVLGEPVFGGIDLGPV